MKNILQKIKAWWKRLFGKPEKEKRVELPLATCATLVYDEEEQEAIESKMAKAKPLARKNTGYNYVIPVVVHVLHKGEAEGVGTNISDAQIYSAINALNEDFSKEPGSLGDGAGATTPFRFMLINKDDQGNPSTGIYRVNGAALNAVYDEHGAYYNGKGVSEGIFKTWSRQNNQWCYNIWIVSEIGGNNGGSGVQGFAYFPTTSIVDGIVQLYNATGKRPDNWSHSMGPSFNLKSYTNLNRTLTHEMGHALALFHTFQGTTTCVPHANHNMSGDRVADTPQTIQNSNGNMPACGGTQQVENYMDYTGQSFKNMFTQGQCDRMLLAFENSRDELITSGALDNLNTLEAQATMSIVSPNRIICPSQDTFLRVLVTNNSNNPIHKINFQYTLNETVHNLEWYGPIAPQGFYNFDTIGLTKLKLTSSQNVSVEIIAINDIPVSISDSKDIIVPTNDPYTIEVRQDVAQGQISWDIADAHTLEQIYVSPKYENFKAGKMITHNLCLPDGEYIFTLEDIIPGMETPNSYLKLIDNKGNVLVNTLEFEEPFSNVQFNFTVSSYKSPDINKDGFVNLLDLSILNQSFGSKLGDPNYNELADLNSDGMVNIQDLSIMSKEFKKK